MRSANSVNHIYNQKSLTDLLRKKNETKISIFQTIAKNADHKSKLDKEIRKQQYFLWNLRHNPQKLVTQLHDEISKVLYDFDINYPLITSTVLCKAIYTLQEHTKQLEERTHRIKANCELMRSQYLQYCGLLCITLNLLVGDTNKFSKVFRAEILQLIAKSHIKFNGDFPDDLGTNNNSISHFNLYNESLNDLFYSLVEMAYSTQIKDKLSTLLKSRNHFASSLFAHATEIINNIIDHEKDHDNDNQAGHNRFNTIVMNTTYKLLQNPYNVTLQNRYLKLANYAHGCPTPGKKLAAAMLSFLGVLLIAGCIYLACVSFGIFAPVAIAGINTIITTFSSGVLGFGTFVGMGVGAYLSISKGLKLFDNNARHGLSLKMTILANNCRLGSAKTNP